MKKIVLGLAAFAVVGSMLFGTAPPAAATAGSWTTAAPLHYYAADSGVYEHSAVTGPDGKIYVMGGDVREFDVTSRVNVYDPATNTWAFVAPMLTRNWKAAAATGPDGRIYVIGGTNSDGDQYTNEVQAYDPATNTWDFVAPMPTGRNYLAAATGPDGKIYAFGGLGNADVDGQPTTSLFNIVEAYDPATDTWTTVAPMPRTRGYGIAAVTGADGKIYVMGGLTGVYGGNLTTIVDAYDPATNTWTTVAPMSTQRRHPAAAAGPDGKIYVFGGLGSSQGTTIALNVTEAYDPSSNTWTTVAPLPTARYSLTAATADGKIYVMGGSSLIGGGDPGDCSDFYCDNVEVFDPSGAPPDPDADDDGIYDEVDTIPGTPSTTFLQTASDPDTTGEIVDPSGLTVTVQAAAPAADGVRVLVTGTGTQDASLTICGLAVLLSPGTDATFKCASLIVNVTQGDVKVELGGGITVVTVPEGGVAEITDQLDGTFIVDNQGTTDVTVTVDDVEAIVPPGDEQQVTTWDFQGFTSPVDNPGVLNVVNAGQAVPLKWRLVKADGTPEINLASVTVRATSLSCANGTTADQLEETATGTTGLHNLGNGYYQFNWKTPKSYAKSCKALHLDLGEGIEREALFNFPK